MKKLSFLAVVLFTSTYSFAQDKALKKNETHAVSKMEEKTPKMDSHGHSADMHQKKNKKAAVIEESKVQSQEKPTSPRSSKSVSSPKSTESRPKTTPQNQRAAETTPKSKASTTETRVGAAQNRK